MNFTTDLLLHWLDLPSVVLLEYPIVSHGAHVPDGMKLFIVATELSNFILNHVGAAVSSHRSGASDSSSTMIWSSGNYGSAVRSPASLTTVCWNGLRFSIFPVVESLFSSKHALNKY